jgi:hypothetical protein
VRNLLIILLIISFRANAQNEFAATAFYNDFRNVATDASKGFHSLKGEAIRHRVNEYQLKEMLPLADSGSVIITSSELKYAVYYFEPEKKMEKADTRALHLREAIVNALSISMNSKTTTSTVNQHSYSSTMLSSATTNDELFQIDRYYKAGKYYVRLKIFSVMPLE